MFSSTILRNHLITGFTAFKSRRIDSPEHISRRFKSTEGNEEQSMKTGS